MYGSLLAEIRRVVWVVWVVRNFVLVEY